MLANAPSSAPPSAPEADARPAAATPRQTFKLYFTYNSSDTKFEGGFDSFKAAKAAAEQIMSEGGQRGYYITDGFTDNTTEIGDRMPDNAKVLAKNMDRY